MIAEFIMVAAGRHYLDCWVSLEAEERDRQQVEEARNNALALSARKAADNEVRAQIEKKDSP